MTDQQGRTEIGSLGEFGLIDRLAEPFNNYRNSFTKLGIGDDAAVFQLPDAAEQLIVSTDFLAEGVHFDLGYVPLQHLGYKAVAVNLSDIAAMNAVPFGITVSIAMSNRFSVEAIEELYKGIHLACQQYGVDLVGGDTTSSRSGLVISVTAMGTAKAEQVSYRSGAKAGEVLCVTGDLGAAYLGLILLEREKQEYLANPEMKPKLEEYTYLVQRQLKPEARTNTIHELKEAGVVPSSMIDISDGLASELLHISRASGVGTVVYEEKLPMEQVAYAACTNDFKISPTTCMLNGGEDYELLFTVPESEFYKIENIADISAIGYTTAKPDEHLLITRAGQKVALQAQGFNHFDKESEEPA